MYKQAVGWTLLVLLTSSSTISTLAYPNQQQQTGGVYVPARSPQLPAERIERKYAEKPNAIKKVALDDLDDIQTNGIQDSTAGAGFSWSNLLGMVMQMIFNPGGGQQGPNKSEGLDENLPPSPWANLLSVGLKILTALLGGGAGIGGDGIDKVDNGGSPMQFINIVVNLLDALKTSFSHRSLAARNLGRKDSISDAAVAGISMMKGYVRSMSTGEGPCMQKYICDANRECTSDVGQSSIFCHLGTYAASFVMERTTGSSFDLLYEAGRRGRSGDNCQQAYLECNEV